MDFTSLQAAATGIATAQQLLASALGVRDFNASAATLARANEQLLNVQQQLFAHMAVAMQLQQDLFDSSKKLRQLEERQDERKRYALSAIFPGVFAYRYQSVNLEKGQIADPVHFLCQPCFDKGIKAVLVRHNDICWTCPSCKTSYVGDSPRDSFATGRDDDPYDGSWR